MWKPGPVAAQSSSTVYTTISVVSDFRYDGASSSDGKPVAQFANLGSYAEYMLVHENAVVKIREDMPLEQAALIGCGVTTGVGAVMRTAIVRPGETVLVIGCGGVGLAAIQGARLAGAARIIAIDRVPGKL